MRSAEALALAAALGACAVSLEDDEATTPDPDAPPIATGCIAGAGGDVLGVTGRLRTLTVDGGLLVVADTVEGPATIADAAWLAPAPTAFAPACDAALVAPADVAPALDATPLAGDADAALLAVFAGDDGTVHAFVRTSRGFDTLGTGVATWDDAARRFVAAPGYLFGAGRPGYGDAALVHEGFVYAYGAQSAGFLAEDCFVARAPLEAITDPTAWRFYVDGDFFGDDPDDAWPIFPGGGNLAVMRAGERVVAVYTTPLGDTIYLRQGLGPTGPWSPAEAVARCALPDGGFCGGLGLHPALADPDGDGATLVVSYGVATFDALPRESLLVRLARVTSAGESK